MKPLADTIKTVAVCAMAVLLFFVLMSQCTKYFGELDEGQNTKRAIDAGLEQRVVDGVVVWTYPE